MRPLMYVEVKKYLRAQTTVDEPDNPLILLRKEVLGILHYLLSL